METLNLKHFKDLKLTANESKYIIKFIAKKRSTTTKKILETINQNQKRRIDKKLTEKQQKLTETQQKLIETKELYLHRDGLRSVFFCLKLCCLLF